MQQAWFQDWFQDCHNSAEKYAAALDISLCTTERLFDRATFPQSRPRGLAGVILQKGRQAAGAGIKPPSLQVCDVALGAGGKVKKLLVWVRNKAAWL